MQWEGLPFPAPPPPAPDRFNKEKREHADGVACVCTPP